MSGSTEKVVLIGARKSLVAIATLPPTAPAQPRPAIIVLNSGIVHRVGHNRMYVALARELAEQGHIVLRIDLSGIGDSDGRAGMSDPIEAGLADVKDAVDWLETARGVKSVVLMGLCSGANQSILYAARDARVGGVVLLDPSIPRTRRYYVNFIGARLLSAQYWRNFFQGRASIWKRFARSSRSGAPVAPSIPLLSINDPAVRANLEQAYRLAVEQRIHILAVFTGGVNTQHNYRAQLLDAMPRVPFGDLLLLEYFERCDHTFSRAEDRRRLFDSVEGWLAATPFVHARDPAIVEI